MTLERQLAFWAAAIALFLLFVYTVSAVLAPFVAGLALGYLLDPVADRLQRAGFSRLGASLCILTVFLSIVTAVVFFAAPILTHQLSDFVVSLPGYLTTLQGLIARISREATGDFARSVYEKLGLSTADAPSEVQKYVNDITAEATRMAAAFVKSLVSGGAALVNMAALVVITPVVAFYILLDWDNMVATLDQLVPPRHREDIRFIARGIDRALAGFVRGQALVCLFLGLWYSIGLSLLGVNFGFLIGVSAGILSFVPYVGSITAFVLSIVVATVQGWPDWSLPAEAVALVCAGLFLDGNVLSPRLVGGSIGVHPVWLMFALLAAGSLFGFTGMLLAAPAAAAVGVVLRFLVSRYRRSSFFSAPRRRARRGHDRGGRARAPPRRTIAARSRRRAALRGGGLSRLALQSRGFRNDLAMARLARSRTVAARSRGGGQEPSLRHLRAAQRRFVCRPFRPHDPAAPRRLAAARRHCRRARRGRGRDSLVSSDEFLT
ncbi:AI-2E family transporter [Methylosinus trichosporium]|uniref:AI-2E family transporter n=1 Tax=Methylosinus trichosporium TaxID=426 RepID=UPI003211ED98